MGFIGIVKIQFHLDACYLFLTKKHFQNCRDEYKILLWNTGITSPDIGGFIKEEEKKKKIQSAWVASNLYGRFTRISRDHLSSLYRQELKDLADRHPS